MAASLFPDPQPGKTALTAGESLAPPSPQLVALLSEARRFIPSGETEREITYCPVCRRRERLPVGATRCACCLAEAIDAALHRATRNRRGWSRDYPACRVCRSTTRRHAAHGYCTRCWSAEKRRERAA